MYEFWFPRTGKENQQTELQSITIFAEIQPYSETRAISVAVPKQGD